MRVTGPTRRRNQAWLEMRERRRRLAQRQVEEEGQDTSDSDSDADGEGTDLSDSDLEEDSEDEDSTIPRPNSRPTVGPGAGVTLLPSPVVPGVTLGAEEEVESESDGIDSGDDDSADESSTAAPGIQPPPATGTSPLPVLPEPTTTSPSLSSSGVAAVPVVTSSPGSPPTTDVPSVVPSRSLDELLTSAGLEPTPIPTLSVSPTAPVAGGVQSPDADNLTTPPQGDNLAVTAENNINTGEAVGIVIGVLALIGLLVGAAFFWKKFRRDRGLPFLPPRFSDRFSRRREKEDVMNEALVPPAFPAGNGKTNTKIMDDLMKAAYDAENGNDREYSGAFGPDKKYPPQLPPPQQAAFMDEKAYVALAGQLTPRTPKKPVSQWLDNVKTPRQSQGPAFPPSPSFPPDADMAPIPNNPDAIPGTITGPRLQPPRPVYGRDTMTTDTTNTSVRWYG